MTMLVGVGTNPTSTTTPTTARHWQAANPHLQDAFDIALKQCHTVIGVHIKQAHTGDGLAQGCRDCNQLVEETLKAILLFTEQQERAAPEIEREIRNSYASIEKSREEDDRYVECPQCSKRFFWASGISRISPEAGMQLFCGRDCMDDHTRDVNKIRANNAALEEAFKGAAVYARWPLKFSHLDRPDSVSVKKWKQYTKKRDALAEIVLDEKAHEGREDGSTTFGDALEELIDAHVVIEQLAPDPVERLQQYRDEAIEMLRGRLDACQRGVPVHAYAVHAQEQIDRRWVLVVTRFDPAALRSVTTELEDINKGIEEQIGEHHKAEIAERLAAPLLPHNTESTCEKCKHTLSARDGYVIHTSGFFCSDCVPEDMGLAKF